MHKVAYHVDVSVLKKPVNSSTSVHWKNVKQVLMYTNLGHDWQYVTYQYNESHWLSNNDIIFMIAKYILVFRRSAAK